MPGLRVLITGALAAATGAAADILHVPSDVIAAADPDWGAGLLGDKLAQAWRPGG